MDTKKDSFRETAAFQKGRSGERLVAEVLQRRGWYVIPSYDYSGEEGNKAPRLQGFGKAVVVPDLDVSRQGKRFWVEVKTKERASFTRATNHLEHGIAIRHYADYKEVQAITGCQVWLCISEIVTREVLIGRLDSLERHMRRYAGAKMNWGGMVFFPRDKFSLLHRATE